MRRLGIRACAIGGFLLVTSLAGCGRDLIFTTYSTIGVELKGVNNVPTAVRLAYKRFEGAIVPVDVSSKNEAHSIFSTLEFEQRGFGIKLAQVFATGDAAVGSAEKPTARQDQQAGFRRTLEALERSVERDGG